MNHEELYKLIFENEKPIIENNRIEDADGSLVRLDKVNALDLEKDQVVRELVLELTGISEDLYNAKRKAAERIQTQVEKLEKHYGKRVTGKRGGISLNTFDRRFKIERNVQKREAVNERIIIVKQMIDDCIDKWKKGANKDLQALVDRFFKKDRDGNYDVRLLRQLRREPVGQTDPDWQQAMTALDDVIDIVGSAIYYKASVRDDDGNYHNIPLAMSDV